MNIIEIYDLLYRLGVSAKYAGFFHTSYAVWLAIQQPDRLLLVTKWLYPDVAKHYNTNWQAVEKNIRAASKLAWELNPGLLAQISRQRLEYKPRTAQFIRMLAEYAQGQHPTEQVRQPGAANLPAP